MLIDGDWRRAPWIDLGDLRSKGAVVVWTAQRGSGRPKPLALARHRRDAGRPRARVGAAKSPAWREIQPLWPRG